MTLLEWLHQLSDMVGGDLPAHADLSDSLEWFGEISEEDLAAINKLGDGNPSIKAFLDLGQRLMQAEADSA